MELPWQSINASQYLTSHFLTNVTEPQLALSFSFRGCLWSSVFLKNFVFQTSHFPCLCIKRNRWCKPQGDKANQIQPPRFQHSRRYRLIHIGPQMAFPWDQRLHLVRRIQGAQPCTPTPERTCSWKWTFGRSPPLPAAWVAFLPINCVFSPQGKVLTVLYLTKYPVLWSIRPFPPA